MINNKKNPLAPPRLMLRKRLSNGVDRTENSNGRHLFIIIILIIVWVPLAAYSGMVYVSSCTVDSR